jgi:hypothetical protein
MDHRSRLENLKEFAAIAWGTFAIGIAVSLFAAWCYHVIDCIRDEQWLLLIVGIFVPPIGWLHGFAVMFGIL